MKRQNEEQDGRFDDSEQEQKRRRTSGSDNVHRNLEGGIEYKDATALSDILSQNLTNPATSDIIIKVGDNRFHAQKMVLCAWSEIFRTMIADPKWTNNIETDYEDGKVVREFGESEECIPVFETFLRFMYTGKIILTDDNIYPILKLADKYMISELKDFCVQYLLQFVNAHSVKNALDTLCHAEAFNVPSVIERCLDVLATYFQQMSGKYFARLTVRQLIELVGKDNVVVNDEFMLFKKVDNWYGSKAEEEENGECCAANMKELLFLIRFEHMTPSQLREVRSMKLGAYIEQHHPELLKDAFRMRVMLSEGTWKGPRDSRPPRLYLCFLHTAAIRIRCESAQKFQTLLDFQGSRKLPVQALLSTFSAHKGERGLLNSRHRFAVSMRRDHGVYTYSCDINSPGYCDILIGCYFNNSNANEKSSLSVLLMPDKSNRGRVYRLVVSLHPLRKEEGRVIILTSNGIVPDVIEPMIRLRTKIKLGTDAMPKHLSVCFAMFVG